MGRTGESTDVGGKTPIRVVLAEDHAEFRLGLKEMLTTDGGIEVVGEAENGAQAVALAILGEQPTPPRWPSSEIHTALRAFSTR